VPSNMQQLDLACFQGVTEGSVSLKLLVRYYGASEFPRLDVGCGEKGKLLTPMELLKNNTGTGLWITHAVSTWKVSNC